MKLSGKPNLRKKPSFLRGGGGSVVRKGRRVRANSRLGAQDACARDVGGAQLAIWEAHRSQGGFGIFKWVVGPRNAWYRGMEVVLCFKSMPPYLPRTTHRLTGNLPIKGSLGHWGNMQWCPQHFCRLIYDA